MIDPFTAALVIGAVLGGLSYKAARDAQKAAKKAADAMSGVLVNKQSNIEAIPVIYGERRVGGTRVFVHSEGGDKNEFLYIALVLGEGEVESISDIEIDDYGLLSGRYGVVGTTDTAEKTVYQSTDNLIRIEAFKGSDTQTASTFLSETSKWGSDHRLNGVAYLAIRLRWDENKFSGMPEITALVKGRKVFDPRDLTTAYSNNPALCIRDYLTNTRYGKGLPASAINDAAFIKAANDVESFIVTPYSGGSNLQLFQCNAVLDTDEEIFRNVERMLLGCRGFLPYANGQYGLVIDQASTSVLTLDASRIIGGISIQGEEKKEKFNRVLVKFPNPSTDWQPDQAIWPDAGSTEETTFLAEDGGTVLVDEVDIETITNVYSARDFARILCLRSRNALRCGLKATSEALNLVVGDVVNVTHPTPGWTNKPFQVEEITLNYDGTVNLNLIEYDSTIYAYDSASEEATYADTDLPDPLTAESASGLLLTPGVEILADGSLNAYVDISWTASADQFVNLYEVLVFASGLQSFQQDTSDTSVRIGGLTVGVTYTVQVVAINSNNIRSGAISDTFVAVGDSTPPGVPTNIAVQGNLKSIDIFWTNPDDKDLSYIEVKESTTANEIDAVSIGRSAGTEYIVSFPNGIFTRYYWLRSVDTSGNASEWISAGSGTTLLLGAGDFADGIIDFDYFNTNTQGILNGLGQEIDDERSARIQALLDEAAARSAEISSASATLQSNINTVQSNLDAEATTRAAEIASASQVLQDQINELTLVEEYNNTTTYNTNDQVTYNGKLYRALQTTTGNLPTNTTYWQLLGDFTSLGDAVGNNTADIIELNTVSASSTSANASTLFGLKSEVENPTTGLAATRATLLTNYYTEAETDSAIASATTGLASEAFVTTELGNYTTTSDLTTNYYTKTATDSAISTATTGLASVTYVDSELGNYTTTADLTTNYYTKTATDSAISAATTGLASTTYVNTQLGNYTTTADLTTNYYTKTQADSAIATEITALETSLNNRVLSLPLDQWKNLGGQSIVSISDGIAGPTALRLTGPGGFPNQGTYIQIDPEKTYRVKFWARPSSNNANGRLYFSLRQSLANGSPGPNNGGRSPYKPSGFTRATHISIYGDTWGEYVYDWTSSDWQTGVTQVLPEFLDNYNNEAGHWDIQGFEIIDATNVAAVEQTTVALASADSALAADISSLTSTVNSNTAAISSEASTRASADSALAADITSLTSTVNSNTAAISSEASTRASADSALSASISSLTSTVNNNTAAISSEAATRADQDSALAADITTVQANLDTLQDDVESANYVFNAADSSVFSQGSNITSIVDRGDYVEITEGTGTRDTSGTTNGAWLTIPADFAIPLAGRRARITVQARAGTQSAFAVAYSTSHVGNSGALSGTAGADWRLFDFFYDVPATSNSTVDYIGIFADNNNGSIEIRRVILSAETQGVLDVEASVVTETSARVSADSALAADITSLTSTVNNNTAAITSEASTRASADSALASDITALTSTVNSNTAAISSEASTRASEDAALASNITALQSKVGGGSRTLAFKVNATGFNSPNLGEVFVHGYDASGNPANVDGKIIINGVLTTLPRDYTNPNNAFGKSYVIYDSARTFDASRYYFHARKEGDTWKGVSSSIAPTAFTPTSNMWVIGVANVDGAESIESAVPFREAIPMSLADETIVIPEDIGAATASALTALETRVTSAEGTLSSQASSISTLQSDVNSNSSAISSEASTRASADSALSTSITNLTTTVSGNTTTIQQQATTIDGIEAQYSVAIDNNGHISGYALISSNIGQGGTPTSAFVVNADQFAIGGTGSASDSYPFVVYPSGATVDGVSIPAGTYIDSARINYLSASNIEAGVLDLGNQTGMAVRQGKTTYTTSGTGFWLGNDNGIPKFIIGSGNDYLSVSGGTIIARGITIRSSSGGTVFDTNEIDGTYIKAVSIGTASIEDLAVTGGKIGNLAVDTLKIANQAVTFPESSFAQSALTKNSGVTAEQTIRTLAVSSTGAPTEVFASFTIDSTYNLTGTHTVRIRRGATVLASCVISVSSSDQYPFAAAITDPDTSSGSRVYSVTIQGFGSWSITNRYIRSLELKK